MMGLAKDLIVVTEECSEEGRVLRLISTEGTGLVTAFLLFLCFIILRGRPLHTEHTSKSQYEWCSAKQNNDIYSFLAIIITKP